MACARAHAARPSPSGPTPRNPRRRRRRRWRRLRDRFHDFFSDGWSLLDLTIVCFSLIGLAPVGLPVPLVLSLRAVRVIRLFGKVHARRSGRRNPALAALPPFRPSLSPSLAVPTPSFHSFFRPPFPASYSNFLPPSPSHPPPPPAPPLRFPSPLPHPSPSPRTSFHCQSVYLSVDSVACAHTFSYS